MGINGMSVPAVKRSPASFDSQIAEAQLPHESHEITT
jgi:hypothetical protein